MEPYVICHMVASLDGRTLTSRCRPEDLSRRELFERLHERPAVDAWLVGRHHRSGIRHRWRVSGPALQQGTLVRPARCDRFPGYGSSPDSLLEEAGWELLVPQSNSAVFNPARHG